MEQRTVTASATGIPLAASYHGGAHPQRSFGEALVPVLARDGQDRLARLVFGRVRVEPPCGRDGYLVTGTEPEHDGDGKANGIAGHIGARTFQHSFHLKQPVLPAHVEYAVRMCLLQMAGKLQYVAHIRLAHLTERHECQNQQPASSCFKLPELLLITQIHIIATHS